MRPSRRVCLRDRRRLMLRAVILVFLSLTALAVPLASANPESANPASAAPESTAPQSYAWRSWTRHDGLRGSQVWTIAQDRDGYLWLGTNEGLTRFDGVRFTSGGEISNGQMPQNSVRALRVARDGSLWIGFGGPGGVTRLHQGVPRHFSAADGLPEALITSLLEDRDGAIWAGSLNGLYRFENGRWSAVELNAQVIDGLFEDSRGDLWIGSPSGVFRRRHGQPAFERVSALRLESFAEDASGAIWSTGGDAVLALLSTDPPQIIRGVGNSAGRRLLRDSDENLWIATLGDGLLRVRLNDRDIDDGDIERFREDGALSSDVVRNLLQDREGNLWVGTQNGLDRVSKGVIRGLPASGDSMSRLVRAVASAADGSVWVGTGLGLYHFVNGRREYFGLEAGLPGLTVSALHGDANGAMWVVTNRGIGRMVNGRFVKIPGDPAALGRPIAITTDRSGSLWLADLDRGVLHWDGRALTRIDPEGKRQSRSAFTIITDREDRIWAGFVDGTIAVHERGKVRLYTAADGLTGGMITSLYEARDGTIWIGASSGLLRFRHGRFEGLSWSSGLPGNIVGAITGDAAGALWLGVSSGIARVHPSAVDEVLAHPGRRLEHVLFDESDGLHGDPIGLGHPTVTQAGDGDLWFVTSDGLAVISPSHSAKRRAAPPVRIEAVVANQQPVPLGSSTTLPPLTASLQIDYTALSFTAPEKVRFRYFMEGFDQTWVDAGTRRQAFYTNLQPGSYRFRVVASNDGVASEHEAVWAFTLAPAFYQTRWFSVALVLLAGAGTAAAWRARVHRVRGRFSAILVERTRVAREIHDTLLQSLLGVMLQLDQAANEIDEAPQAAKDQLSRLRQQVEYHIREARHSIRDLRSPVLQTRDLATALREVAGRLTAGTSVAVQINSTGTPFRAAQRVEEHLLRIGQEAISNAVRHGRPRAIEVTLDFGDGTITLRVADNGAGFDPAAAQAAGENHWGLASMQERTQQIGGTCCIVSTPGHGTVVTVTAPVRPVA